MITSGQTKAARALLGLTVAKLAEKSGIGFTTLVRMESSEGIPASNVKTLDAVQRTLEEAGIEFIGTPSQGPGFVGSLRAPKDQGQQFLCVRLLRAKLSLPRIPQPRID